jgi:hypothetical protein
MKISEIKIDTDVDQLFGFGISPSETVEDPQKVSCSAPAERARVIRRPKGEDFSIGNLQRLKIFLPSSRVGEALGQQESELGQGRTGFGHGVDRR